MANRKITEERFWSKVNFFGPTAPHVPGIGNCWIWMAARDKDGYGKIRTGGRDHRAHRVTWALANGDLPADKPLILHRCDNPQCVRPDHLRPGTNDENMAEMAAKGRVSRGDAHWSSLHPERRARGSRNGAYSQPHRVRRGEGNGRARLTEDQVREIRRRHAGGESSRKLGRKFGVAMSTILRISSREIWAHVN